MNLTYYFIVEVKILFMIAFIKEYEPFDIIQFSWLIFVQHFLN
jgi:hypothetical protein